MKFKPVILLAVLLLSILCGGIETAYSQTRRGRSKAGARHIWQKNSQRKASFLSRDGAISHGKTRRGACSHHRGIARTL